MVVNQIEACLDPSVEHAKLSVYSGHDTSLLPVLNALGVDDGSWPKFASNLIFELYRGDSLDRTRGDGDATASSSEFYVRVTYNDVPRALLGCGSFLCPLGTFLTKMSEFTVTQQQYEVLSVAPYLFGEKRTLSLAIAEGPKLKFS